MAPGILQLLLQQVQNKFCSEAPLQGEKLKSERRNKKR